jgi:hypothetical protein
LGRAFLIKRRRRISGMKNTGGFLALFLPAAFLVIGLLACGGGGGGDGGSSNAAPVANAGLDQSVAVCATVALDGGASADEDGDALTYGWSLSIRPEGSMAALSGSDTAVPTLVPDVDGAYTVSLVVNDGTVDGNADTVTVTAAYSSSVSFSSSIQPVFDSSCISCHVSAGLAFFLPLTSDQAYNNLVYQPAGVTEPAEGFSSDYLVKRCDSTNSALYQRVSGVGLAGTEDIMPLGGTALTTAETQGIQTWIDEGAPNN